MTTDLYSTVFFQDGEQFTFDDANNMQRFLRAQLADQILQQFIGDMSNAATRPDFGADGGANASSLWAYCMSPGRAFLRQGSANNKIQLAPGTLLQKIANADGNDATLVPFTFAGTEEWTIASGDATNPRVDLLQMALAYVNDTSASVDFQDAVTRANTTVAGTATRRRIQCTLSVKTGTPGASPIIPDPDAGCVPVGCAVVGHGWTSAGAAPIFGVDTAEANKVVIHDQRMPMQTRKLVTDPVLYKLQTAWALSNTNTTVTSSSTTNALWIRCPTNMGRIVCVDLYTAGVAIPMSAVGLTSALAAFGAGASPSNNGFGTNVAADTSLYNRSRRVDFEALHTPFAGPTIQASSVNKIGVPLWAGGFRVPGVPNTLPQFAFVKVTNSNVVTLGETIWYIAS